VLSFASIYRLRGCDARKNFPFVEKISEQEQKINLNIAIDVFSCPVDPAVATTQKKSQISFFIEKLQKQMQIEYKNLIMELQW